MLFTLTMQEAARQFVDIFEYADARVYLNDAINDLKKARAGTFSLRALSRRFGIASVATLSMVLTGKRGITPAVAVKCVEILKLKGARRRYFLKLVELSRASDLNQKAHFEEQLLFIRKLAQSEPLSLKQYEFLSEWYFVAIFVLAGQPNFFYRPEDIARRLGRGMTKEKVERAVNTMKSLGLLKEDQGQLIAAGQGTIKTEEDIRSLSIRRFQLKMIELARQAFAMAPDTREITALTFSFPPNAMPAIKEKIRQFREELDGFASSFESTGEVYQLNVQLFPLTQVKKEHEA